METFSVLLAFVRHNLKRHLSYTSYSDSLVNKRNKCYNTLAHKYHHFDLQPESEWTDITRKYNLDGLVQERRNSLSMELRLSCTNPSSEH